MKTTNGKRGGNLVGKPHNDTSGNPVGGIKAVVTDAGGKPVELEGGEVIINKEASKKHWKELSKINQSAGNGVPIEKPIDPHDEDPSEYKEGGKIIEFNRNHVPNSWILTYAKGIKKDHPEIWKLGGNIYGNTAFENLCRVSARGYWLDSEEWMYIKWRSYVARHRHDFRIEGVVAMLKWVDKVDKGWRYMKDLIEAKIKKGSAKPKSMKTGGELIKRADGSYSKRGLWDNIRDNAGSGKKPTKQMLEQEAKINAESMRDGGNVNKYTAKKENGTIFVYENGNKLGYLKTYYNYNQRRKKDEPTIVFIRISDKKVFQSNYSFQNDAFKYIKDTGELFFDYDNNKMADGGSVGFEDTLFDELAQHDAPSFKSGGLITESEIKKNLAFVKEKLKDKKLTAAQILYLASLLQFDARELPDRIDYLQIRNKLRGQIEEAAKKTKKGYVGYLNEKEAYHFTDIGAIWDIIEFGKFNNNLSITTNFLLGEKGTSTIKDYRGMGNNAQRFSDLPVKIVLDLDKLKTQATLKKGSRTFGTHFGEYELIATDFKMPAPYYIKTVEINKEEFDKVMQQEIEIYPNYKYSSKAKVVTMTFAEQMDKINIPVFERKSIDVKDYLFGENAKPKYEQGGLIAPNGKKSNLTPEQYKLVRTPEFKAWFGEWEKLQNAKVKDSAMDEITLQNLSKDVSKVVDENGEPLVLYHGTRNRFSTFDIGKGGESNTVAKVGFWFTPIMSFANNFSDNSWWGKNETTVYSVFLNIKNPKIFVSEDVRYGDSYQKFKTDIYSISGQTEEDANIGGLGMSLDNANKTIDKYRELLVIEGYDGLIIKKTRYDQREAGGLNDQFVSLFSTQIKLADGSNTTFDGGNPDIRYKDGGIVNSNMILYHGGNLDDYDDVIAQKNGRYEYGAGLYLTTHQDTARKYAKGSRKLYKITLNEGVDINDAYLKSEDIYAFISKYVLASKKAEVKSRISKYITDGKAKAFLFNNIILNEKAIAPSKTMLLRQFYVDNGIDYDVVDNPFGWGETMVVLYNMDKLKTVEQVGKNSYAQGGELTKGIAAEMEHKETIDKFKRENISDKDVAKSIALDHLKEDPNYYTKLNKMENKMANGGLIVNDKNKYYAYRNTGNGTFKYELIESAKPVKLNNIEGDFFYYKEAGNYFNIIEATSGMGLGTSNKTLKKAISDTEDKIKYYTKEKVDELVKSAIDKNGLSPRYSIKPQEAAKPQVQPEAPKPQVNEVKPQTNVDYGSASFLLKTPTGEISRLTYLQQVLVRTKAFKDFFGDWEIAAKSYLLDNKNNREKHYENVSKVIDWNTLEPRAVYHGTRVENEFFQFDVSKQQGVGRPYAYFAHNIEYSNTFTQFSQRGQNNGNPFMYNVFLSIKKPFMAIGKEYEYKRKDADYWFRQIVGSIVWDKYKQIARDEKAIKIEDAVRSQIYNYIDSVIGSKDSPFWVLMANDTNSAFKYFLMSYNYDGIFYGEEIAAQYDADNPAQYSRAITVFNPNDIKLSDGRNLNFDRMESDIRLEKGGNLIAPEISNNNLSKKDKLSNIIFGNKFEKGGSIDENNIIENSKYFKPITINNNKKIVEEIINKMKL